jgi:hypothetical protein
MEHRLRKHGCRRTMIKKWQEKRNNMTTDEQRNKEDNGKEN